jgi:membrane protein DedA with SNARE-associated domain
MHDLFKSLFEWYGQSLGTGGYWLVALLMAIESSIVPLPSELVIPPAAIIAHRNGATLFAAGSGNMSLLGIVLAGAIGSWVGATAMYWVSRWAGRPLVMRYGKFIFIPPAKVEQAERWAAQFGSFGVFASRLLPVVRHLIGIPAGIVRMNYVKFSIFTLLGSGIWCAVLVWVGLKAGADEALMRGELHRVAIWLVAALAVLGAIYYVFVHRYTRNKSNSA